MWINGTEASIQASQESGGSALSRLSSAPRQVEIIVAEIARKDTPSSKHQAATFGPFQPFPE
jgi:hypothetical protein